MISIEKSNLVITGLEKVFWKGKPLQGLIGIDLKKSRHRLECKIQLAKGENDPTIIEEIKASGVFVKEVTR